MKIKEVFGKAKEVTDIAIEKAKKEIADFKPNQLEGKLNQCKKDIEKLDKIIMDLDIQKRQAELNLDIKKQEIELIQKKLEAYS